MKAQVYYLTWDEDRDERNWTKQDIKDGETDPADLEHYRPVITLYNVGSLGEVWDRLNRDPAGYQEELDELEERSMCKGDLIVMNDEAHIVRGIGFEEVNTAIGGRKEPEATGC